METTKDIQEEKGQKSDKNQSNIMVGIGLLLLSALFVYIALSQPRINVSDSQNKKAETYSAVEDTKTENDYNATVVSSTSAVLQDDSEQNIQYPLNLNTCTAAELMTISNIGETRANAIISYREYLGGYTSVDELKNISGIGEAVFESIEPYVTV